MRMHRSPSLALAVCTLTLVNGCAGGWRRVSPTPGVQWPARQRARIWRGGHAEQWHAVRVGRDSLSGVPFIHPPSCDSCRVAVALAQVDSVCAGPPDAGQRETVFLVGLGLLLAWFVWCATGGCNFEMSQPLPRSPGVSG